MRERLLFMLLVLTTLFAGSALAAEAPVTAPEPAQTAPGEMLPDELLDRLTPEPTDKYGILNGPCTVTVRCGNAPFTYDISCSGQTVCKYKVDNTSSPYTRGFVECDGWRTSC